MHRGPRYDPVAAFNTWINDSINGQMSSARKNASIIMMDYQNNPVKRYNMRNAGAARSTPAP
ncbi:phage tail protein [Streptomyces stelliscabiei]